MTKLNHFHVAIFTFLVFLNCFAGPDDKRPADDEYTPAQKNKKPRRSFETLLVLALFEADREALDEILTYHREAFFTPIDNEEWRRMYEARNIEELCANSLKQKTTIFYIAVLNGHYEFLRLLQPTIERALVAANRENLVPSIRRREVGNPETLNNRLSNRAFLLSLFDSPEEGFNIMEAAIRGDCVLCLNLLLEIAVRAERLGQPLLHGPSVLTRAILNPGTGIELINAVIQRVRTYPQLLEPDETGMTPLHAAAFVGCLESFQALFALLPDFPHLRLPMNDGLTLLGTATNGAVATSETDLLDWLLQQWNTNPWIADPEANGGTALHLLAALAAQPDDRVEPVLLRLLERASDIPALLERDAEGRTALFVAASFGHSRILTIFVHYALYRGPYAALLLPSASGENALHAALRSGDTASVRLLLSSPLGVEMVSQRPLEEWDMGQPRPDFRVMWRAMLAVMPSLITNLDRPAFRARFPELTDMGRIETAVILSDLSNVRLLLEESPESFNGGLLTDMMRHIRFAPGWRLAVTRILLGFYEFMRARISNLEAAPTSFLVLTQIIEILDHPEDINPQLLFVQTQFGHSRTGFR